MYTLTYLDQKTGAIHSTAVIAYDMAAAEAEGAQLCKWAGWMFLSVTGDI